MGVELQGFESCFKLLDVYSGGHTDYIIRSSFAIPVHKTCEDSCDKGVQFILEAAPSICLLIFHKAWFPLVLRIVRIGDFHDLPMSGILTTSVNTPPRHPRRSAIFTT